MHIVTTIKLHGDSITKLTLSIVLWGPIIFFTKWFADEDAWMFLHISPLHGWSLDPLLWSDNDINNFIHLMWCIPWFLVMWFQGCLEIQQPQDIKLPPKFCVD